MTVRKTIEVDVVHEELKIRYEPGNARRRCPELLHPLQAEEVGVVKHVRVAEEVVISKRRVVEENRIDVMLKHERLEVLDAKLL